MLGFTILNNQIQLLVIGVNRQFAPRIPSQKLKSMLLRCSLSKHLITQSNHVIFIGILALSHLVRTIKIGGTLDNGVGTFKESATETGRNLREFNAVKYQLTLLFFRSANTYGMRDNAFR